MKPKFDEVTHKFIMACKSEDRYQEVLNVYKEYYGDYDFDTTYNALVTILSRIVEDVSKKPLSYFLNELLSKNMWKYDYNNEYPLNKIIVNMLISELTFIRKSTFIEEGE